MRPLVDAPPPPTLPLALAPHAGVGSLGAGNGLWGDGGEWAPFAARPTARSRRFLREKVTTIVIPPHSGIGRPEIVPAAPNPTLQKFRKIHLQRGGSWAESQQCSRPGGGDRAVRGTRPLVTYLEILLNLEAGLFGLPHGGLSFPERVPAASMHIDKLLKLPLFDLRPVLRS